MALGLRGCSKCGAFVSDSGPAHPVRTHARNQISECCRFAMPEASPCAGDCGFGCAGRHSRTNDQQPEGRFAGSVSFVVLIILVRKSLARALPSLQAMVSHRNPSSMFLGNLSLGAAGEGVRPR